MKIIVFGKSGQVATELQKYPGVLSLGRPDADLIDQEACETAIRTGNPDAVINAAAYTDVERAEQEEPLARRINADAPGIMARTCAEYGIPFVHISSDYVFSGLGNTPWSPDDTPFPINAYGRSKLMGEDAIRAVGGCHAVLRTSWIFSAHGRNFVKTMLKLSESQDEISVVSDQIGGPTPAAAIAAASHVMACRLKDDPKASGTYHLTGAPDVSWYTLATEVFAQAGRNIHVQPMATAEFTTRANRPLNSRLDCTRTEKVFGLKRPDWRQALHETLNELGALA